LTSGGHAGEGSADIPEIAMFPRRIVIAAAALALVAAPALAQTAPATVDPAWVAAHQAFLAGDALRGRGSATHDETVAAAYVAAQFQGFGLQPAPGMDGYTQTAAVIRTTPSGQASLSIGGVTLSQRDGLGLLSGGETALRGRVEVATGNDPATLPAAEIVMIAPPEGPVVGGWISAAFRQGSRLVILRETATLHDAVSRSSAGRPGFALAGAEARPSRTLVVVPAAVYDRMTAMAGTGAVWEPGPAQVEQTVTTNAVGWLPGTDPDAGVILIGAHLDHLGVRADGTIMHGANDDASGTTAVLELARALSSGEPHRRGILFVAYGSEEIGGLGSSWFGDHPPVPLGDIVANLAIEMIGAQDPRMPDGVMMMTGFDRSNFGAALRDQGALIAPDLYPEQNFFERSDNYQLALRGVVAHTISGWAVTPTYHSLEDTNANLDIPFMTRAIQSLVGPLRWLADSDFVPEWAPGGRPERR
jgi:aminopeptidase YwaD